MTVDVSEAKIARNPLGLWGGWKLATAASLVLGSLPYVFLLSNLSLVVAWILIPLSAGFLVGLFQWLVTTRTIAWRTSARP